MPTSPSLRERYTTFGPREFGSVELLALVLGTGAGGHSARVIASQLLDTFGSLGQLRDAPVGTLARVKGVGPARAIRVHAALHLAARSQTPSPQTCIDHPAALVEFFRARLGVQPVETFWMVGLNTRLQVMGCHLISRGSQRCTVVDPAEVFRHAISTRMSAVAVAHNHPSGDPAPSAEDRSLTKRLVRCGQLLGIPVLDHIIIAGERHWSFEENEAMPRQRDLRLFTGATTVAARQLAPGSPRMTSLRCRTRAGSPMTMSTSPE